jgi:hypothetical protein
LWTDLSFWDNPYSTDAIPGSDQGSKLFVGRSRELAILRRQITSSSAHTTLEGPNGVGKSSLVAVACHRMLQEFRAEGATQLFLPLKNSISVTPGLTSEVLGEKVLLEVAQAFVDCHDELTRAGREVPEINELNAWLNNAVLKGRGGGVTVLGSGASGSTALSANTSHGFARSGLMRKVLEGINSAFASREHGGFVAVLDNVELAGSPSQARALLEAMRDPYMSIPGLRWVMCGARGVLRGACGSSRLSGVLGQPVEIKPLDASHAPAVVETRIEVYRAHHDAYGPVDGRGFLALFELNRGNLRTALEHCEQFSSWAYDNARLPETPEPSDVRLALLSDWIRELCAGHLEAVEGVAETGWLLFDELVKRGGLAYVGDIGASSDGSRRRRKRDLDGLEDAGLIQRWTSPDDRRRRSVNVTATGWLVRVARTG